MGRRKKKKKKKKGRMQEPQREEEWAESLHDKLCREQKEQEAMVISFCGDKLGQAKDAGT